MFFHSVVVVADTLFLMACLDDELTEQEEEEEERRWSDPFVTLSLSSPGIADHCTLGNNETINSI